MLASWKGDVEIVRTVLKYGAEVQAKDDVRNQMMIMMMTIIIVLTMMMTRRRKKL
jgi:hypothetical protein